MRRAALLACWLAWAATAAATSTIDRTQPANGSPLVSATPRANFGNAANDIETLQAKFPGVSAVGSIPTYGTTAGGLATQQNWFIGATGVLTGATGAGNADGIDMAHSGDATSFILHLEGTSGGFFHLGGVGDAHITSGANGYALIVAGATTSTNLLALQNETSAAVATWDRLGQMTVASLLTRSPGQWLLNAEYSLQATGARTINNAWVSPSATVSTLDLSPVTYDTSNLALSNFPKAVNGINNVLTIDNSVGSRNDMKMQVLANNTVLTIGPNLVANGTGSPNRNIAVEWNELHINATTFGTGTAANSGIIAFHHDTPFMPNRGISGQIALYGTQFAGSTTTGFTGLLRDVTNIDYVVGYGMAAVSPTSVLGGGPFPDDTHVKPIFIGGSGNTNAPAQGRSYHEPKLTVGYAPTCCSRVDAAAAGVAGADTATLNVFRSVGSETTNTTVEDIQALSTSTTAALVKTGLNIAATGNWSGTGASVTGLNVTASGGTTTLAIHTVGPIAAGNADGSQATMRTLHTQTTTCTGATCPVNGQIPPGAIVWGVVEKVIDIGSSTCTSLSVGDVGNATRYGVNVPFTNGAGTNSTNFPTGGVPFFSGTGFVSVLLTCNGGTFTLPTIQVTTHYLDVSGLS